MKKEIVVVGAGKIGRGSAVYFFSRAGWKVYLQGHTSSKMEELKEQGYFTIRNESGKETRVEDYEILDCSTDDALVEKLSQVNLCCVATYIGAFESVATSIAKAIKQRVADGFDEPLNVLLCVNEVSVVDIFDSTIRPLLTPAELDYYERNVGLCVTMVMSLGGSPSEDDNPWLVLTSDNPMFTIDADPWKGEKIDVEYTRYTTGGLAQITRKVFVGNMNHAMKALLGSSHGWNYMDDGVAEDAWLNACCVEASEEALFAVTQEFTFDPAEVDEFRAELAAVGKSTHDPFARILNNPEKKLGYAERFVWPLRKCFEHGRTPYFLAKGTAYGLLYLVQGHGTKEYATPTTYEEVLALVEEICGLGKDDRQLQELVAKSYIDIPATGFIPAREA